MTALLLGFGNPSRNRLNPNTGANVTRVSHTHTQQQQQKLGFAVREFVRMAP